MLKRIHDLGLQIRLFIFLGIIFTPLVVLLGVNLASEYQTTIAAAKNDVTRMAEAVAAKQSSIFQEAKAFLDAVRQTPEISVAGGAGCNSLLARLNEAHPQFFNIGVVDNGQMIVCHSKIDEVQTVGDPAFFAHMSRANAPDFDVSEFLVGKDSRRPTVVASMRLPPVDGTSRGVVFVSMNLEQLLRREEVKADASRTVALIEMPSTRLLAQYPTLDVPLGTPMENHPLISAIKALDNASGEAEGVGEDGIDRLFGYAPIEGIGDAKIIAGVGLPRADKLAGIHHRVAIAVSVCGAVLVMSFMAAWWIGFWTQLWPIARLRTISQQIASGDFAARAMIERWQAPEFRALGSVLDAMAEKLEEGRKAEKAIADSNRYFEITERLAQVGYWQLDLATMKSTWSDEVFRIYGLSPQAEPPSVDTIIDTFHPNDRETIERAFEKAIGDGTEFEIQLRLHRTGGLRHVLSRGRVERDKDDKVVLVYGAFLDITEVKDAELKAQSANAMLKMAEEMAEVGHWRVDLRGDTVTWSEHVYRMHGLDPAKTPPPTLEAAIRFYHPDDRQDVEDAVAAAIAERRDYEFHKRIIRSDSSIRNVVSRGRCEIDPASGEVVAIFGVVMDVTALLQVERNLREKSALLETTLETIDQGLIMISNDGRLDVSNRRFAELLDLPHVVLDAPRPDFEDILDYLRENGEYAATSDEFQNNVRARGKPFSLGVYERRRPNGSILEVRTTALPDGTGIVRTYTDVTDRRKAELALQESEARYRILVENASDMIFRLDRDFVRTYVSSASMDILGFRPEELVGRRPVDMVHPSDADQVAAAYGDVLAGVERTKITNRIRHRDGHWIWVEVELRAVRDPESREVLGIAGIMRDISERQAQRDLVEAARRQAEEALRVKGDFLAVMSHELRTPLNGIIGFANLLGSRPELTESPASPYVRNIQTASRHLLSIVNDVLDVSKGEAGALQLDPKPFVFRHFVKDTVSVIADEAETKGLGFRIEIDPTIPERLLGDDARLRQVLVNLISNSLKFTAVGHVAFEASLDELADGRASIRFCISDTGIGIPKDKLDTLFQRFMQADQSISRRFGGTGLGLSICKDILELMDSRIHVSSTLGQGSSFEFTIGFPVASIQDVALERETAALTSLGPLSILVAEDVPMNQDLLRLLLEQWGHSVEIVSDGVMAVAAVAARPFDLILMDIHMPGMDGIEATRLIRAMEGPAASTPIIALTANVFPDQIATFLDAGMNSHVAKPFMIRELHASIEACGRFGGATKQEAPELDGLRPVFEQRIFDDLTRLMGAEVVKGLLNKLTLQIEEAIALTDLDLADVQAFKRKAHSLVSSAGFLGFQRLSDACAKFENTPPDLKKIRNSFEQLAQTGQETLEIINGRAA